LGFHHAATPPTQAAIKEVRSLVDYRQIRLDVKNRRAGLGKQGMLLDLGGLAKGYAADRAKQVLIEWGIESAYINLGGNVLLLGSKPDGSAWKVGIRHPRIQNSLVGAIAAKDVSVVTSGDYERFFIDSQGKRQHHILDPRTAVRPLRLDWYDGGLPRSLHADALSTTFFLSGIKGAKSSWPNFPK
jgi:thiamine biosynthesis lipoprotein